MKLSLFLSVLGLNFVYGLSSTATNSNSNSISHINNIRVIGTAMSMMTHPSPTKSHGHHPTTTTRTPWIRMRGGSTSISTTSTPTPTSTALCSSINPGGGGGTSSTDKKDCPMRSMTQLLASLYGTGGVIYILMKAIVRVVPIALEPFKTGATPLTTVQLGAYIGTCLWFAYVEGYKGFQTKFSPLVVTRSLTLEAGYSRPHHYLLAPLYSMGLFHATRKRMTVSWCVTLGVAGIVHAVKKLPYPWRNIVDAGVVVGLTYGTISIVVQYIRAIVTGGKEGTVDPALPKK